MEAEVSDASRLGAGPADRRSAIQAERMAVPPTHRHGIVLRLIRRPVVALDRTLRRRAGIVEFTDRPDCILRMAVIPAPHAIALSDGTRVEAGQRIIDLHLWNEHIPYVERGGPSLRWGRWMGRAFAASLRMLAHHLAARPDLGDIKAIRANMNYGSPARSRELGAFAGWFGFEQVRPSGRRSPLAGLHLFGENILLLLLTLAHNVHTFRWRTLLRGRSETYLSRSALDRLYGAGRRAARQ